MRLLFGFLLLASACASTSTSSEPTCPPRCLVRWTYRDFVPVNQASGRAGTWRYHEERACDARCEYLGEPVPRTGS